MDEIVVLITVVELIGDLTNAQGSQDVLEMWYLEETESFSLGKTDHHTVQYNKISLNWFILQC